MDFSIQFAPVLSGRAEVVIAFGVFDGVHIGHRQILRAAGTIAGKLGAIPVAVSFWPHPRAVLTPEYAPELLLSREQREERLRKAGAAAVGFIDFTWEFAALEPENFLDQLIESPDFVLKGICVGENYRFGRGGSGNAALLREFCGKHGLAVAVVPHQYAGKLPVSSSAIRKFTAEGNFETVCAMLGTFPRLTGVVTHGFGVAGPQLNSPTANLEIQYGVMVPDGVYAGSVTIREGTFPAAVNIGFSPTFGGTPKRRVEVTLLGFSGNLYDRELSIVLYEFLRKEERFPDISALKMQIRRDCERVTAIFRQHAK